jgi:hypothetical protein
METLLLIAVTGTLNIVCFFIGAKTGQMVAKGKDITVPTINPMEMYRQHQEKQHAEEEKSKIETILRNIDRYDGTEMGQEDVPRG